jgi:hypothetical protein
MTKYQSFQPHLSVDETQFCKGVAMLPVQYLRKIKRYFFGHTFEKVGETKKGTRGCPFYLYAK